MIDDQESSEPLARPIGAPAPMEHGPDLEALYPDDPPRQEPAKDTGGASDGEQDKPCLQGS